jgi:hypothetical protein
MRPHRKFPSPASVGISTWKDAVEFMLLGATTVQVCTAAMKHGFRIVEDLCEGLNNWMDEKGFATINDFIGKSVPTLTHWEDLDINYHHVAKINQDKCIHCGFVTLPAKTHHINPSRLLMASLIIPMPSKKKNVLAVIYAS